MFRLASLVERPAGVTRPSIYAFPPTAADRAQVHAGPCHHPPEHLDIVVRQRVDQQTADSIDMPGEHSTARPARRPRRSRIRCAD